MKRYVGTRTPDGCAVEVIDAEGGREPLDPRYDLRAHSPSGFNHGYSGSGPAQLALALLADALADDAQAARLHQDYKRTVVARLQGDEWELKQDDILATVAELEAERWRSR